MARFYVTDYKPIPRHRRLQHERTARQALQPKRRKRKVPVWTLAEPPPF